MLQEYQFTQLCAGGNYLTGQIQGPGLWIPGMSVVLFPGLGLFKEDISKLLGNVEGLSFYWRIFLSFSPPKKNKTSH